MKEIKFSVGPLNIRAQQLEIKASNLAYKFIDLFKSEPNEEGEQLEVYNLTINGTGRYYYSPDYNILRMYVLNEFVPVDQYNEYKEDIKRRLTA